MGHGEGATAFEDGGNSKTRDMLNEAKMKTACCCYVCSPCYLTFPDCIGCYAKNSCLWNTTSWECSKIFCGKVAYVQTCCISPHDETCCGKDFITLCGSTRQNLCMLEACNFPCNEEVPFSLGLCGVFCVGGEHWQ